MRKASEIESDLIRSYQSGTSIRGLSDRYRVGAVRARAMLVRAGVVIRDPAFKKNNQTASTSRVRTEVMFAKEHGVGSPAEAVSKGLATLTDWVIYLDEKRAQGTGASNGITEGAEVY